LELKKRLIRSLVCCGVLYPAETWIIVNVVRSLLATAEDRVGGRGGEVIRYAYKYLFSGPCDKHYLVTLAMSSRKHNVLVWHPSICRTFFSHINRASGIFFLTLTGHMAHTQHDSSWAVCIVASEHFHPSTDILVISSHHLWKLWTCLLS